MCTGVEQRLRSYILSHQRLRCPLVEDGPSHVWVELQNAQGVTPGQGQTVRVAGMRVGDVGKVELEDGRAVVTLQLDPAHDKLLREAATLLLRPRTGLKDMFIELDPGTNSELVDQLDNRYPGMRQQLMTDDGSLHRFVNVYLEDEDIRYLDALDTKASDGQTLSLLPSVAGGSPAATP
jgi:molybdopterin converting factor small subunit